MFRTVLVIILFSFHMLFAQPVEQRVLPVRADSTRIDTYASFERTKSQENEVKLNLDFTNALEKAFSFEFIETSVHNRNDGLTIEQLHEWIGLPEGSYMSNMPTSSDSVRHVITLLEKNLLSTNDWKQKEIHIPGMAEMLRSGHISKPLASFDFGMMMGQLFLARERRLKKLRRLAGNICHEMDYIYPIFPEELQIKERDTTESYIINRLILEVMPVSDFSSRLPSEHFCYHDSGSHVDSTTTSSEYMIVREENCKQWNYISTDHIKGFTCDSTYNYVLLVRKYVPRHTQIDFNHCNYELIKVINKRKYIPDKLIGLQ